MNFEDVAVALGAIAVTAGVALLSYSAGLIVAGLFLLVGGVLMGRARAAVNASKRK